MAYSCFAFAFPQGRGNVYLCADLTHYQETPFFKGVEVRGLAFFGIGCTVFAHNTRGVRQGGYCHVDYIWKYIITFALLLYLCLAHPFVSLVLKRTLIISWIVPYLHLFSLLQHAKLSSALSKTPTCLLELQINIG